MAANVVLQLKKRPIKEVVQAPVAAVKSIIESGDRNRLWSFFEAALQAETAVHDKVWLQVITNWVPKDGASIKDISKWMGLVRRVEALDDAKEGPFTLSLIQSDLIWSRLTDPAFKLNSLSPLFMAFIMEYMAASRHNFEGVSTEWDEPELTEEEVERIRG